MNATEQIALLRRACEMAADWTNASGQNMATVQFCLKHGIPSEKDGSRLRDAERALHAMMREALYATATPPDDDVARLTKERDEALAKLAAKEKELADISIASYDAAQVSQPSDYAAKPEPEFFTEYSTETFKFNVVRRIRPATSLYLVAQCASGDDAQRIADALNAGGKP